MKPQTQWAHAETPWALEMASSTALANEVERPFVLETPTDRVKADRAAGLAASRTGMLSVEMSHHDELSGCGSVGAVRNSVGLQERERCRVRHNFLICRGPWSITEAPLCTIRHQKIMSPSGNDCPTLTSIKRSAA